VLWEDLRRLIQAVEGLPPGDRVLVTDMSK